MKLGFIGCGNMATAMLSGIISSNLVAKEDIMASDLNEIARVNLVDKLQIATTLDNREVAQFSDYLVLAVKPHFYDGVINEIKDLIDDTKVVISIAPGKTLDNLQTTFGKQVKLIRAMPNTPAMVNEGMSSISPNENITTQELCDICNIFNSFGKSEVLPEKMIDAVISVSGSSPAYVYMFIEALADGAVSEGMPRDMAYKFAAQAVMGSAKMVLETGMHPGILKDNVCSPGGSTIEAVKVLEKAGFRSSVLEGMQACADKARRMG